MSPTAESLLNAAMDLTVDDRLVLAEALYDSIHPPGELPFDPAWIEVARRRTEAVRSGRVKTIPWDEVRREAREAAGG